MIVKIDMTKSLTDKWKHEYSRPRTCLQNVIVKQYKSKSVEHIYFMNIYGKWNDVN